MEHEWFQEIAVALEESSERFAQPEIRGPGESTFWSNRIGADRNKVRGEERRQGDCDGYEPLQQFRPDPH